MLVLSVAAVALPHWSWATVQTFFHCANRTGIFWSDEALAVLAKQAFVVFEKNHGLWAHDAGRGLWANTSAEAKITAACAQLKAVAPGVQCLMYVETDWARTYYSLGHEFDARPELELHAAAGWRVNTTHVQRVKKEPVNGSTAFSYRFFAYDFGHEAAREMWIRRVADAVGTGHVDGAFIDGNRGGWGSSILGSATSEVQASWRRGLNASHRDLVARLGPGKTTISNYATPEAMAVVSGGMMERGGDIEHIVQFVNKWPGSVLDFHAQYADRSIGTFNASLAAFLVGMGPYSYFGVGGGWDGDGPGACASWLRRYPEYSRPLGKPLEDGRRDEDTGIWTRRFASGTRVWVNESFNPRHTPPGGPGRACIWWADGATTGDACNPAAADAAADAAAEGVAAASDAAAAPTPRPNIVLVLADDLDHTLGSVDHALPQTRRLIGEEGATAKNWFIHTPICCPSRAELLAGRYFHNLRVATHNAPGSCMQANLTTIYDEGYFARTFADLGYTVGIFGKHLNNGNPTHAPEGVDRWLVNGGGEYLNPSFAFASGGTAGEHVTFDNCTGAPCYSTSVIGNATITWLKAVRASPSPKPFLAYVAVKAPHIQDGPGWPVAIPAPWHDSDAHFRGISAPRTPNWNASCPSHHWLVRSQPPMTATQAEKSDALYRSRLRSLLAVDDLVGALIGTLRSLDVLSTTYVAFTSDHGFRFGQFSMPEGKWNAYENDLRIPFLIRGPSIPEGSTFEGLASNVDVMPTLLDLVGGSAVQPAIWDGRSAAQFLLGRRPLDSASWRTELLIEYFAGGDVVRYEHLEDAANNSFRLLRRLDPARKANLSFAQFVAPQNWDFRSPVAEAETELFHLDEDPFEMRNVVGQTAPDVREELVTAVSRLYGCSGTSCN